MIHTEFVLKLVNCRYNYNHVIRRQIYHIIVYPIIMKTIFRMPHYDEHFTHFFESCANTIDNFRTESILVPIESANSGLSIGTKIMFVRKLSVLFAQDSKKRLFASESIFPENS